MRKRNVEIMSKIYSDDSECIKIMLDSCWLYVYDFQSLDFFNYIIALCNSEIKSPICFNVKFSIPINGKSLITIYSYKELIDSFPLVSLVNSYIEDRGLKDFSVLPDIIKFVYFFMPKYLVRQLKYYIDDVTP